MDYLIGWVPLYHQTLIKPVKDFLLIIVKLAPVAAVVARGREKFFEFRAMFSLQQRLI